MNLPSADVQYNNLVRQILTFGDYKTSRGGAISSTFDLFGAIFKVDLRNGFPLLTTKKVVLENVYHELNWFLRGETNINTLKTALKPDPETGARRTIWSQWADANGGCGPIYGAQWRNFNGHDQMNELLRGIKHTPDSRRLLVTAWNPNDVDKMALPPCHYSFQCRVVGQFLDLHMTMRSCDVAVGLPYNIASYAILTHMLAKSADLIPRYLSIVFGSAHIYEPHVEDIKKQIEREPRESPVFSLKDKDFWWLVYDDTPDDYGLDGYNPHKYINYQVEV